MAESTTTTATIHVLYPRTPTSTFNLDYYLSHHMPFTFKHWKPYGFKSYTVTAFGPNDVYSHGATMIWDTIEGLQKAQADPIMKEILDDVKNYSDQEPIIVGGMDVGRSSA